MVNKTLHDLKSDDKPIITIFNKMDLYEKNTYDEWLEPEIKEQLLKDLETKWLEQTQGKCVFMSATEKTHIDDLRQEVLNQVRDIYQKKYPYKAEFFY